MNRLGRCLLFACLAITSAKPPPYRLAHGIPQSECPCDDVALCNPVQTVYPREVFGFYGNVSADGYKVLPYGQITTMAWAPVGTDVVCYAHAKGTRLIAASPPVILSGDAEVRAAWVRKTIAAVQAVHFDGVNFDYESAMVPGAVESEWYTLLVQETTAAMHAAIPGSQVSIDFGWIPNADRRYYNYTGLAAATDISYVMDYDTRSQIVDRCAAGPNAPLAGAYLGIEQFRALGVPADKIVLGVPWYGYDYPCAPGTAPDSQLCLTPLRPFRGVNCSDASGYEVPYQTIMGEFDLRNITNTTTLTVDSYTAASTYNYITHEEVVHQRWFDGPAAGRAKAAAVRALGLRGIGPFCFDYLDLTGRSGNPLAKEESAEMWEAMLS